MEGDVLEEMERRRRLEMEAFRQMEERKREMEAYREMESFRVMEERKRELEVFRDMEGKKRLLEAEESQRTEAFRKMEALREIEEKDRLEMESGEEESLLNGNDQDGDRKEEIECDELDLKGEVGEDGAVENMAQANLQTDRIKLQQELEEIY